MTSLSIDRAKSAKSSQLIDIEYKYFVLGILQNL